MKKRILWSNININAEDYKWYDDDLDQEVQCDDEQINDILYDDLDMLRDELNVNVGGAILVIADLGLWFGRRSGYKIIASGNIKDIFYDNDCDLCEWYIENGNLKATACHHDGANYYTYRAVKNADNIQSLLDDLYNGKEVTRSRLNYYTRTLSKDVSNALGWSTKKEVK